MKDVVGTYDGQHNGSNRRRRPVWRALVLLVGAALAVQLTTPLWSTESTAANTLPAHAQESLNRCKSLHITPGPPQNFTKRRTSDRFVQGTRPVLLRNARIWTGSEDGKEIVHGSIFMDGGLIKAIGRVPTTMTDPYEHLEVIDLHGAWVTPGIVDVHSHVGDAASPALDGAQDDNSIKGPTQPWLRSLDGLNTHDDSYRLSLAGGVTTANVLPGSANAIGGQAFTIKLRPTAERSVTSMLLEAPFTINGTKWEEAGSDRPRWRQLKQACGENPSGVYGFTRMDTIWSFRAIYNEARKIKERQDEYCSAALSGDWNASIMKDNTAFPEDLRYEALVDVLRGKVKVHTHCYEAVDLDALVRLTQEFKFPVAAVHHAHEAYLVPDLLKSAYGAPPGVAIFAANARYKREAYRGSEFAARILDREGLKVVMKSDHPVMVERDLLFEAQQAFYYGMPWNRAIASVTSTAAEIIGMGHRVGRIRPGYDADVVVWDSHPLALGATPTKVFVDGISQLHDAHVLDKPKSFQELPRVPNFDKEAEDAVKYEGLPPLMPVKESSAVLFTNVASVVTGIEETFSATGDERTTVLVRDGKIECMGTQAHCASLAGDAEMEIVDLDGGAIQPALTTYGAPHGVVEIDQEGSTNDGYVLDATRQAMPALLDGVIPRAADGLSFQGRDTLLAYRSGVTSAISAPRGGGLISGLGVAFSTGASHKLEKSALVQRVTALHVAVDMSSRVSVSTQIGTLRRLLLAGATKNAYELHDNSDIKQAFSDVAHGRLTLVVEAHSADIISSLILLKSEVESHTQTLIKMTITHASEAHLLAPELAAANIGVVLVPARPFPSEWQDRRILPGPPLSKDSQIAVLHRAGVKVAIGVKEAWDSRNTALYLGWAALEANGTIGRKEALAMGSSHVRELLGVEGKDGEDLMITKGGGVTEMGAKVVGVVWHAKGVVSLF